MVNDIALTWTNSELFWVNTWLYLSTEFIFHSCILDPILESDPEGVIFIIVLLASYPVPPEITLILVIFPSVPTDSNLANAPVVPDVPPIPTTSSSGGVVYSDPKFNIFAPVIFPSETIGAI